MSDINNLFTSLENIPLFRPIYIYKKQYQKNKMEKNGKSVNVYTETYKINYKKIVLVYIIYSICIYLFLKFVYKM